MGIDQQDLPNRLRWFRELEGYTQQDVATIFSFKSTTLISEWETGATRPSLEYVLKLSILYRTLPAQLFCDLYDMYREEISVAIKEIAEIKLKSFT